MRKVSEMFQAPTIPKVDGMNKLLEQIRNKVTNPLIAIHFPCSFVNLAIYYWFF